MIENNNYNFNLNFKQQEAFQRLLKSVEDLKAQCKKKKESTEEEKKVLIVEASALVYKKVKIGSKIYTFVLTKKQEVEFQDILKMKDENKAIEYIKLHFGYFLNIDYKKAYDCLNKLYNYYCYRF